MRRNLGHESLPHLEPSSPFPSQSVTIRAKAQTEDCPSVVLFLERDGEPNGGHPGSAPHQHRPPQLLLFPQRSQAAVRGAEGVGGDDGDGEAGHQGGAQPARVPPLRARRPPVAQVGVREEQVPVDLLGQGDVLPAPGEGEGVPGGSRGGVRGDRCGGPRRLPQGHELHLGRRRGRRQALQLRVAAAAAQVALHRSMYYGTQ